MNRAELAWERIPGPKGGAVAALALGTGGTLFAGVNGGRAAADAAGVFGRTAGGDWRCLLELPRWVEVSGLACRGEEVCVATPNAVWRSTDGGAHWTDLGPRGAPSILGLAFDGIGGLCVGTYGAGVHRLGPGGWMAEPGGPRFVSALGSGTAVFVLGNDKLERRTAAAWQVLKVPVASPLALAVDGRRLAMIAGGQVWLSLDGGDGWRKLSADPAAAAAAFAGRRLYLGGSFGVQAVELEGSRTFPVGGDALSEVTALASGPEGDLVAGTRDGRVARVRDQGVEELGGGFFELCDFTAAQVAAGELLVGTAGGVHVSADAGDHWQRSPGSSSLLAASGDTAWLLRRGTLWRRDHSRLLEVGQLPGLQAANLHAQGVVAFGVAPDGALWVSLHGDGLSFYPDGGPRPMLHAAAVHRSAVFQSTDAARTWTEVGEGFSAKAFAFGTAGEVHLGGDGGLWTWRQGALQARHAHAVNALAVAPDGRTFAASNTSVYVAQGEGTFEPVATRYVERGSWGSIEGDALEFVALATDPAGRVWGVCRGLGGGAFRIADKGRKWESHNLGLTMEAGVGSREVTPTCIAFITDGTGFVGTAGRGLFRRRGA